MSPADYKSFYDFQQESEAAVQEHADRHYSGTYTIQRTPHGFVGCFGPASGLFTTPAFRQCGYMPCYNAVVQAMSFLQYMYAPAPVVASVEAYCINSNISQVELIAAAFHQGHYTIERTDEGQYVGAFGNPAHATPDQHAAWFAYPTMETLLATMAMYPDQHGLDGWPSDVFGNLIPPN